MYWKQIIRIAALLIALFLLIGCATETSTSSRDSVLEGPLQGMQFVVIPEGSFIRETRPSGAYSQANQQIVYIDSFEIMSTEVTQGMWQELMGQTIYDLADIADANNSYGEVAGAGTDFPVYFVSWYDCQEFISRLNELDSRYIYRLPSDAEWVYASKAGTTTLYYWGNEEIDSFDPKPADVDDYAWTFRNSNRQTHPVGLKEPNSWGLFDMIGNVEEWCEDNCNDPTGIPHYAPTDGSAWLSSIQDEGVGVECHNTLVPIEVSSDTVSWILSDTFARVTHGNSYRGFSFPRFPSKRHTAHGFRLIRSDRPGTITLFTPEPLFETAGGLISDFTDSLQWRFGPDSVTWYEAKDWADDLGANWRMPTVEDLNTFVSEQLMCGAYYSPEGRMQMWDFLTSSHLWTGDVLSSSRAYRFHFSSMDGGSYVADMSRYFSAIAVRSIPVP